MKTDHSFEEKKIQFSIPWDSNTARGFAIGIAILLLLLFFAPKWNVTNDYREVQATVPDSIITISFGMGNKPKGGGNLTKEGTKKNGQKVSEPLRDAETAPSTKSPVKVKTDISQSSNIKPVKTVPSQTPDKNTKDATGQNSIGMKDGTKDGTGLGHDGFGKGSGYGYGIEWGGGGGNRQVMEKYLPEYPPGVTNSAQIKIRFTVLPNGTVGIAMPMQKGEPALEKAALSAIRRWRFNPIQDNKEMAGVITFSFKIH